MKQCMHCGAQAADDQFFCANCGRPVSELEQTTVLNPDQAPRPRGAMPTGGGYGMPNPAQNPAQNPAGNPYAMPNPAPNPAPNPGAGSGERHYTDSTYTGNPYTAQALHPGDIPMRYNPYDIQPKTPPKKKRIWLRVLILVIVLVVVLAGAGIGVAYGVCKPYYDRAVQTTDLYYTAYINGDAETLAEYVPEGYWSYISEEYGYTRNDCVAAYHQFMAEQIAELGEGVYYAWSSDSFHMHFGKGSVSLEPMQEQLEDYDLSCDAGVCLILDVTIKGDEGTDHRRGQEMWIVRIDDQWYSPQVMADIDMLCKSGDMEEIQVTNAATQAVENFYNMDADAVLASLPDSFWEAVAEEYSVPVGQAQENLRANLNSVADDYTLNQQEITSITLCDEEQVAEVQESAPLEYCQSDRYYEVKVYIDAIMEGESGPGTITLYFFQKDGQWYATDMLGAYAILSAVDLTSE